MPIYISIILAFLGMLYFSFFLEAVGLLFLSDILYGVPEAKFFNITFVTILIGMVLLVLIELLKKKLKFYPQK